MVSQWMRQSMKSSRHENLWDNRNFWFNMDFSILRQDLPCSGVFELSVWNSYTTVKFPSRPWTEVEYQKDGCWSLQCPDWKYTSQLLTWHLLGCRLQVVFRIFWYSSLVSWDVESLESWKRSGTYWNRVWLGQEWEGFAWFTQVNGREFRRCNLSSSIYSFYEGCWLAATQGCGLLSVTVSAAVREVVSFSPSDWQYHRAQGRSASVRPV